MHTLFTTKGGWKRQLAQIIYVVLLFGSATAFMICTIAWIYQEIITHADDTLEFYTTHFNTTAPLLGNVFFIITNFLADSLLLWRTWVVWGRRWVVVLPPGILLAASTAMSMLTVYQIAQPNTPLFSSTTLPMILPYFSLSISLNLILTLMIVTKLLLARRSIHRAVGEEHGRAYVGVAAMVVESAALYSVSSIVFIATYAQNLSVVFSVFLPLQVHMMCISPLLIIIRVAKGRAFTQHTVTAASSGPGISFAHAIRMENSRSVPFPEDEVTEAGAGDSETKLKCAV
ncbi:hypothetical protein AURDEDRAFT_112270 [Auricularia subglabra TFB-10046 SS5]|nr:hypothetical protein AURDEDRAFT_112270 [Auricularia subglabra TFB-10046 SS5]